jgi:hypothetical protein
MHDPGTVAEILMDAQERERMTPAQFCAFVEMDVRDGAGLDAIAAARRYFTNAAEQSEAIAAIDKLARVIAAGVH